MKKIIAVIILFLSAISFSTAQVNNGPKYRNALLGGFSYEWANSNGQYFTYSLEYTRHIKNRLYWGVTASFRDMGGRLTRYDWDGEGADPYRNSLSMDIPTIAGMVYYELPVIGQIVALRGGAGVGLGYHMMQYEDADTYKDKFAPYFILKLQWVVRPLPRLELNIAPLVIGPSSGGIAPWLFGSPSDKKVLAWTNMMNIQIGYRF